MNLAELAGADTVEVVNFFIRTAYLWILPFVFIVFWRLWISYIQRRYISTLDWALLEIKIPRDVHKSPAAMEIVLHALLQTGGTGSWLARWWQGKVRSWFSLEIASVEGNMYFFIRTERKYKDLIMSQIYSQYPQAEITEVDDYARYVPKYEGDRTDWKIWGSDLVLTTKDGYPIKTYVDYGMDKDLSLDEEKRIDPMTPMIEFLGSLMPGEQVWIQIMVRAATNRYYKKGTPWWQTKRQNWVDETQDIIKEYLKDHKKESGGYDMSGLTNYQKEVLAALERSIMKPGFDTMIRLGYLAQADKFRAERITGMLSVFKQYNAPHLNGFKPSRDTDTGMAWNDYKNRKVEKLKISWFENYLNRAFFHLPDNPSPYILNTEELATIFHFPSRVAETPTFERVEAVKSQPPVNLPI